jgi:uroporphyrinogen-III synthase/AcrR family transcriptional regulator
MMARGGAEAKRTRKRRAGVPAPQGRAPCETARDSRDRGDRSSMKREDQILDAAARLFGGRDLSVVTMEEIATRAGVAKGTLYNYFPSKEALYSSILATGLTDLLSLLQLGLREEADARGRLKRFVAEELSFLLDRPDFFRMLRNEETRPAIEQTKEVRGLRDRLRDLVRSTLGQGMTQGTIRPVSSEWAADLILGTVEGAVLRCIEEGCKSARRAEESEALFDFLWRSLTCSDFSVKASAALSGVAVLVTREEGADRGLSKAIERLGGTPVLLPLLATEPPEDLGSVRRVAGKLSHYDWILFTSARGAEALFLAWGEAGSPPIRRKTLFGAVGDATARAVLERFGRVDLVASEASGEGMARDLRTRGVRGLRFLLARAERAGPELPALLREAGGFVEDLAVYRTRSARGDLDGVIARLSAFEREVVTFASPSAVFAFGESAGFERLLRAGGRVKVATIGATTSAALRSLGFEPDAEAREASFAGLASAAAAAVLEEPAGETRRKANGDAGAPCNPKSRSVDQPAAVRPGRKCAKPAGAGRKGGSS